jgi:hypothetical protein
MALSSAGCRRPAKRVIPLFPFSSSDCTANLISRLVCSVIVVCSLISVNSATCVIWLLARFDEIFRVFSEILAEKQPKSDLAASPIACVRARTAELTACSEEIFDKRLLVSLCRFWVNELHRFLVSSGRHYGDHIPLR